MVKWSEVCGMEGYCSGQIGKTWFLKNDIDRIDGRDDYKDAF